MTQAIQEETGYAEIARKEFLEAVESNLNREPSISSILERSNKNKKNYPRLPINFIKNVVSRLRRSKSKK